MSKEESTAEGALEAFRYIINNFTPSEFAGGMECKAMNVYSVIGQGNLGGGMAIVSAVCEEEARRVAGTIRDNRWHTDYADSNQVKQLPLSFDGMPCVIAHYESGE